MKSFKLLARLFPVILVLDTGIHLENSWIPDEVGNDEITHDDVY